MADKKTTQQDAIKMAIDIAGPAGSRFFADPEALGKDHTMIFANKNSFVAMTPDPCGARNVWRLSFCGTREKMRQRGLMTDQLKRALSTRPEVDTITMRFDRKNSAMYHWAQKRALRIHELHHGEIAIAIARQMLIPV